MEKLFSKNNLRKALYATFLALFIIYSARACEETIERVKENEQNFQSCVAQGGSVSEKGYLSPFSSQAGVITICQTPTPIK